MAELATPNTPESEESSVINGAEIAARILSRLEPEAQERIRAVLEREYPEVAAEIAAKTLHFDAIADLNPRAIQTLLREVPHQDVLLSFQAASDRVKETIFQHLSERRQETFRADLESLPPGMAVQVREAQGRILEKLEKLRDRGLLPAAPRRGVWV